MPSDDHISNPLPGCSQQVDTDVPFDRLRETTRQNVTASKTVESKWVESHRLLIVSDISMLAKPGLSSFRQARTKFGRNWSQRKEIRGQRVQINLQSVRKSERLIQLETHPAIPQTGALAARGCSFPDLRSLLISFFASATKS
jgi:hypothetical protein